MSFKNHFTMLESNRPEKIIKAVKSEEGYEIQLVSLGNDMYNIIRIDPTGKVLSKANQRGGIKAMEEFIRVIKSDQEYEDIHYKEVL